MWGSVSTACNSRRRLSMPKPHVQNTSWISAEHKGSCCTYAATWGTTEVLPIFHILVQISTLPFTCQHKECGFLLREGNLKCYHCIRKLRGSHILLDGNDFQSWNLEKHCGMKSSADTTECWENESAKCIWNTSPQGGIKHYSHREGLCLGAKYTFACRTRWGL